LIFVDTGALLARHVKTDQHHRKALSVWSDLGGGHLPRLFTSNLVLSESLTLISRRAGQLFAAEVGHSLFTSSRLEILRPTAADELNALVIFRKFADQNVSFADCVSFVLMRSHRIARAFTFDRHFRLAGFETVPERV
jgi:predicted nucleic acid-binding protein